MPHIHGPLVNVPVGGIPARLALRRAGSWPPQQGTLPGPGTPAAGTGEDKLLHPAGKGTVAGSLAEVPPRSPGEGLRSPGEGSPLEGEGRRPRVSPRREGELGHPSANLAFLLE